MKYPKVNILFHEKALGLSSLSDYLSEYNISGILIGDTHEEEVAEFFGTNNGSFPSHELQEDFVKAVKPTHLLHEFLYDKSFQTKEAIQRALTEGATVDSLEMMTPPNYVLKLGLEYNLRLIGCDLPDQGIWLDIEDNRSEEEFMEDPLALIDPFREKRMGETLRDYMQKSDKPVIEIVGNCHLVPESKIYDELSGYKVLLVYASFEDSSNFHMSVSEGLCTTMRTKVLEL